jgi:MFS family permease
MSLKRMYQQSPFGLVASLCGVTSAFFALGPILAQRLDLGTRGVAVLMASGTLGGLLLAWPIGWLSDRSDRRFVIVVAALTATGALFTIIALVRHARWSAGKAEKGVVDPSRVKGASLSRLSNNLL